MRSSSRNPAWFATAIIITACSRSPLAASDASGLDAGDEVASLTDAAIDAPTVDAPSTDASVPVDTGPSGAAIGEPCADDDACRYTKHAFGDELPACLGGPTPWPNGTAWTNGYCATFCAPPPAIVDGAALEQRDCPMGSLCVPLREAHGICLRGCAVDADCRTEDGYYCRRAFGGGTNETPSTSNGVCMAWHCQSRGCPGTAVCGC